MFIIKTKITGKMCLTDVGVQCFTNRSLPLLLVEIWHNWYGLYVNLLTTQV